MTRAEAMKKNRINKPRGAKTKNTADVRELAGQHTTDAITKLAEIARDNNHSGQVAALKELLNRACGLPAQAVSVDVSSSGRLEIIYINDWRKRQE